MKKIMSAIICFLCLSITIISMAGCANAKTIVHITDMERFADMQESADSIEVEFDNHTGKPFKFTVEDKNDITEIMNIVLTEELADMGKEYPPVGDNTWIIIYQGEKSYRLSVRHNSEKDVYYGYSFDLQSKIIELATAQGAYDTRVGVIYKVIDLQDKDSIGGEKTAVADKTAMLALLENSYSDYEYFYLFDSFDSAEQYYTSGITEHYSAAYRYDDSVMMGKDKLLLIYYIYQNYKAESYYVTSPSLGEYVDNGDSMNIELAFGLYHYAYLHIHVVS